MNILIDFTQIPIQKMGVGVYGLNLISNLKYEPNVHYYIIIQDDDTCLDKCESNFLTLIKVNSKKYRKLFYRFLLEQFYIPFLVNKYKIQVIHSLHYSFPIMAKANKIVTICDMIFYKYPELHIKHKVYYFRFFIWLTTKFADKIICISKSTQQDYLNHFKISSELTTVIELGKAPSYNPNIDQQEVNKVLSKYAIHRDYILFIGTIEPRKNISTLLLAYSRLANEGLQYCLVIVGKKGWHYDDIFTLVTNLGLSDKVIFTGFVDEVEKPAFLAGAKIFIYPSIYEGFGIPVLEALACGVPTITSNISSMPEVAGDAALLIDPTNADELYNALCRLIFDDKLRADLKNKAIHQANKFNWRETARKTSVVYKGFSPH